MKGVEQLLAELREHGTIDSQGEFTLSLSEARRKLVQYHSSDQARYLLHLLAAGTAAGARGVTVEQTRDTCRLLMPGAHIAESALLKVFADPARPSPVAGAGDMVLGLQGAFHFRAVRVEVKAQRPGESFLWTLEPNSESSVPIESGGDTCLEVTLHFRAPLTEKLRGLLQSLRGYAAKSAEARLLDRFCDRSLIPLTYNGERCDRPLFLPTLGVLAQVGELGEKRLEFTPDCRLPERGWRGVLALGPGAVQIVIHGVAYCQVESLGLVGTIYHDRLERDLSRERVVRDRLYDELLADLEEVRVELSNRLVPKLVNLDWSLVEAQLPNLVHLFLTRRLSGENRKLLWQTMEGLYKARTGSERTFEGSAKGLLDLLTGLMIDAGPRERVLTLLLADCGDDLRDLGPGLHKQMDVAQQLVRAYHPDHTLVLGYLLLGLGAVHAVEGRKNESERAWFRALETVWSGSDARAQELMYGHMAYSPEHIIEQTSAALAMYCDERLKAS